MGFPNRRFECHAVEEEGWPPLLFQVPLRGLTELIEAAPSMATFMRSYAMGVLAREVQMMEALFICASEVS